MEFIEDLGLHDNTFAVETNLLEGQREQSILAECVRALYSGEALQQESPTDRVGQMLTSYSNVNQVDLLSDLNLQVDMTPQPAIGQSSHQMG